MKNIHGPALAAFNFGCTFIAIYMAIKQIHTYLENADTSAVSFQLFTDGQIDRYPTYTFCLEDSYRKDIYVSKERMPEQEQEQEHWIGNHVNKNFYVKMEGQRLLAMKGERPYNATINGGGLNEEMDDSSMPNEAESTEKLDCKYSDSDVRVYHPRGQDNLLIYSKEGKFYAIRPDHYQALLMGTDISFRFQANALAECKEVKYSIDDVSKIVFRENIVDLNGFLLDFHIKTINGSILGWINETYATIESVCIVRTIAGDKPCATEDSFKTRLRSRTKIPHAFQKVYQDPRRLCYSPVLYPGLPKKSEHITLELRSMVLDWLKHQINGLTPVITMHVHMQGQFVRSLGKEIASLTAQDLVPHCPEFLGQWGGSCHGIRLNFDISQVTLLKSRHDAEKPCNDNLKDEDKLIISTILKENKINCVPDFWHGLFNNSNLDYQKCMKPEPYKKIALLTSNFTSYELLRNMIKPPCEEMIIVTNVQNTKGRERRTKPLIEPDIQNFKPEMVEMLEMLYLDLQVTHVNDRYQVITNHRGFTGESCWSGIGGFIGIFVGFSLMQLPEVILGLCRFVSRTGKIKDKIKVDTQF